MPEVDIVLADGGRRVTTLATSFLPRHGDLLEADGREYRVQRVIHRAGADGSTAEVRVFDVSGPITGDDDETVLF